MFSECREAAVIDNSGPTEVPRARFRMDTGLEVLEAWADNAGQSKKNAVYKALFAVTDGSVFRTYRIVDDFQRANEFFVIVRDDLVLKVRVHCFDSFGVVYIGPSADVPNLSWLSLPEKALPEKTPAEPVRDAVCAKGNPARGQQRDSAAGRVRPPDR